VVTLRDVVLLVRRLAGAWVGGAVLGLVVALAAGFLMKPVYRATTVVIPVSAKDGGIGALPGIVGQFSGIAGLSLGDSTQKDEALAVLKSQLFTQSFIADQNLLPVLFADRWNADTNEWIETDRDLIPTEWDAWMYFDREVRSILEDRDRGLVTIRVEWHDPVIAASWANSMVERVNEELRSRKLSQLEASLAYLQQELRNAEQVELRQAISRIMESQINERMLANAHREFAFRVIDPAVPPDSDQPERPKRLLLAVLGGIAGAFAGFLVGLGILYTRSTSQPTAT